MYQQWIGLFGIVSGGTNRSVPDGNVGYACSACQLSLTSHVTVSSQSQRQPFTLLSSTSDVNARPSQSASSQQSVLGYPLQSPPMEGSRMGQPRYCDKPSPFVSPLPLPPQKYNPREIPGQCKLRLREHHLRRPTATSYRERYMRLEPQDLTRTVVKRGPRRGLSTISPRGFGAFFPRRRTALAPQTLGVATRAPGWSSLVPHWFDIERNLLDMKTGPCLALVTPLASGFLLITEIDAGCSFFVHAFLVSATDNWRACIEIRHETFSGGLFITPHGDAIRSSFESLGTVYHIEPRQTRGFHANEEPRWIRRTKFPASKLYVLIL